MQTETQSNTQPVAPVIPDFDHGEVQKASSGQQGYFNYEKNPWGEYVLALRSFEFLPQGEKTKYDQYVARVVVLSSTCERFAVGRELRWLFPIGKHSKGDWRWGKEVAALQDFISAARVSFTAQASEDQRAKLAAMSTGEFLALIAGYKTESDATRVALQRRPGKTTQVQKKVNGKPVFDTITLQDGSTRQVPAQEDITWPIDSFYEAPAA